MLEDWKESRMLLRTTALRFIKFSRTFVSADVSLYTSSVLYPVCTTRAGADGIASRSLSTRGSFLRCRRLAALRVDLTSDCVCGKPCIFIFWKTMIAMDSPKSDFYELFEAAIFNTNTLSVDSTA